MSDQILIFHYDLKINDLKILQRDFLDFFSLSASHNRNVLVMKMTNFSKVGALVFIFGSRH